MATPRKPARSGLGVILVSTGIAGLAGYATMTLVFRSVGPVDYALFAVFWAALYLVVGGLSGIQQEIARGTRTVAPPPGRPNSSRNFGIVVALIAAGAVAATSPLWGPPSLGADWLVYVAPIAIGAGSYVIVATVAGSLAGTRAWGLVAVLLALDAVLRLLLIGIGLGAGASIAWLAWLAAIPFPLTLVLVWPWARGRLVGRTSMDVGYEALARNVARTLMASFSTAVLVSGFPLIAGFAAAPSEAALLGELVFAIILVRAPLIIGVMSLQSYLVVTFRDHSGRWLRRLIIALGTLIASGILLGAVAAYLGPPVLEWLGGHASSLTGPYIGMLVVSSALIAALSVSSAALLARSHHLLYGCGWLAAAVATIIAMALPLSLMERVGWAVMVGPIAGLLVHVIALAATAHAPSVRRSSSS